MRRLLVVLLLFAALAAPVCADSLFVGTWQRWFLSSLDAGGDNPCIFVRFRQSGSGEAFNRHGTQPLLWKRSSTNLMITILSVLDGKAGTLEYTFHHLRGCDGNEETGLPDGYYVAVDRSGAPTIWRKLSDDPDYPIE